MSLVIGKILFSILITILQKMGVFTKTEAIAAKAGDNILRTISHIKTYSSPSDFPTEVKSDGP